jgi:5-methylcytosine-specific restriction endonuclease McrA
MWDWIWSESTAVRRCEQCHVKARQAGKGARFCAVCSDQRQRACKYASHRRNYKIRERACLDCGWNLYGYASKCKRCEICQHYYFVEVVEPRDRAKRAAKMRAYARDRYAADPDRFRAQANDWRKRNPEKFKTGLKTWRKHNPDLVALGHARRRWRLKGKNCTSVTRPQWRAICEAHGYCCAYCGAEDKLTLDHVVPLARGGLDEPSNVVPACGPCNASKGAKLLNEWRGKRAA